MAETPEIGLAKYDAASAPNLAGAYNQSMDKLDERLAQSYYLGPAAEVIPAGGDLNNYTTPGIYRTMEGDGGSPDVANKPAEFDHFQLIVEDVVGNSRQTFIRGWSDPGMQQGSIYTRFFSNIDQAWGGWLCTSGVDSIVAEGDSGGWHWVKYASGLSMAYAEVWHKNWKETTGNPYPDGSEITVTLPFVMTNYISLVSGQDWTSPVNYRSYGSSSATAFNITSNGWSGYYDAVVGIYVIGTWK